jgi:RAS protein activator-like 2
VESITGRYLQEKWHPVEKSSRRECPSVRLKCHYQSVDILPLREYEEFLYYLKVSSDMIFISLSLFVSL